MSFSPKKKVTMRNASRMLFLLTIFLVTHLFAEEVCKFEYLGLPELLDGDTIFVPVRTVAMSEYVRIGDPGDLIVVGNACSIMFLVDVSGSNAGSSGTDPDAERFDVMSAVIDTIYKKNPKVYVGLTYFGTNLWFNPSHDPVFIDTPGEKHGVIPLLQLDKMYNGHYVRLKFLSNDVAEQYDYTKAGIDVLKLYFRTQYINPWGIYPAYWADASQNGLTGINEGFTGTKHAMETTSPHSKDKQFIIFFSDGGATTGTEYTQAVNTPTTFTIFYNPSSNAWQELQQFNANVQTNGFSTSNTMSNAWNLEMDKETLIKLIVDDILSQIITSMTTFISNDSVYINGLTGIKITEEGFCFEDLFPLKKYTDFHYEIDYHITKDSIASNGDTVTIAEYDSTVYVDYTVCVDDGDSLSDTIRLCWWDRDLAFYHNGDEIEEDEFITEVMDEIELRFSYKEVDTLYEYGDVMDTLQFELRSVNGGDIEEYDLSDQGTYWSCNVPREVGTAGAGDGTLQHTDGDSIIAIFRNGKLPLDTLRIGRLYDGIETYTLTQAIYFDNSADGHVDSVYLGIEGNDIAAYVDNIMTNITLPAHRDFTVGNYAAVTGGIGIPVIEKATATLTYVTNDDVITITDSISLGPDAVLLPGSIKIIDSIAPVIMTADVVDSADLNAQDELTVVFSETIEAITESQPFKFYQTASGTVYGATLSLLSQSTTQAVFAIQSISGASAIVQGDSIWINASISDKIRDGLGNRQDNPDNIKREINVQIIEDALRLQKAIYFDNDANGKVDSIFLNVTGTQLPGNVDGFMNNLVLPAHRDFIVGTYALVSGGIGVYVTENAPATLTYVTDEDIIVNTDTIILSPDAMILPYSVKVIDSLAPVIMTATFVDSMKENARDELTVTFSENVEAITRDKPFKYYSIADSKTYDGTLGVISQTGAVGVFELVSLDGVLRILDGDSIRIHWIYDSNVKDAPGNDQNNAKNIRREINVKVVEKGMAIESGVYFDNNADGKIDSIFVGITGKKVEEHVDDLKPLIELPEFRKFTIDDYRYSTGGMALDVTEGNPTIMTYVTVDDIIRITQEKVFPDGESVVKSEAPAIDSIAPVIIKADFVDSLKETARDELTIIFSENVEAITPDKPFEFYNLGNGSEFFAILRVLGQSANRGVFEVQSIEDASAIENGDSIRIYWIYEANVYDVLDNNQDNKKNRRVEIAVNIIPDKYDLIPEALIYRVDNEYSVPANFYDIAELEEVLSNTAVGNGMHKGITIITLRPDDTTKVTVNDSLSGSISIYDAVGNPIIINRKLGFDKARTRLVYIWDGRNELGRHVGPSGYVAVMPCTFYHRGKFKWDLPAKSIVVGVKE